MNSYTIKEYPLEYLLGAQLLQSGVGHGKLRKLLKQFESNEDLKIDKQLLDQFIKLLSRTDVKILPIWDDSYPHQLKNIPDPPVLLFFKGDLELLNRKLVCIVGSRKCTFYGRRVLRDLLERISSNIRESINIVSGLAYGIDSFAHRTALQLGIGTTAIVAGGIDQGFPMGNLALYDQIADEGLIIAEFPPGILITKGMFPMRNRLMSGICEKVVVIEASNNSGSLITAGYGAEYGKEVYAVPGRITDPQSKGCNQLLCDGAIPLVRNSQVFGEMVV